MPEPNVINIIKKYLNALILKGLIINKAILYGSQATGRATDESDIDLLLVSPLFDTERDKYAGIIWMTTEISDFKIEPVAIGEKRWLEDNVTPIIVAAKQEGIEIYPD